MHDTDNHKLIRSKAQNKSKTKSGKNTEYDKITAWNEIMKLRGQEIKDAMYDEQRNRIRSKSNTLHFVHLIGLSSMNRSRSLGGVNHRTKGTGNKREYVDSPTPVGITLRSDIDIQVPVIDIKKNKDTGIDIEKDITYKDVKAGEEFDLTYYEFMFFMLINEEYGAFFEANGNPFGAYLSFRLPAFMRGEAKLPTPTINFAKGTGAIKASIVAIDEKAADGRWIIKGKYAEKFGSLLGNVKSRSRSKKSKNVSDYPKATLISVAINEILSSDRSMQMFVKNEEELLSLGINIITSMGEKRRKLLGSKSASLHLNHELHYVSKRKSTIGIESTDPVGVTLVSDEDIQVPEIKNSETGFDHIENVSFCSVKAGVEFDLTLLEYMFLITQEQYAGYCGAFGDPKGAYFSPSLVKYFNGETKLPIPRIQFVDQQRLNIRNIFVRTQGALEIRPKYMEKFGALLN